MAAEQFRAGLGVAPGLHRAELCVGFFEHDRLDIEFAAKGQQIVAALGDETVGEEVAVADHDCDRGFRHLDQHLGESVLLGTRAIENGVGDGFHHGTRDDRAPGDRLPRAAAFGEPNG